MSRQFITEARTLSYCDACAHTSVPARRRPHKHLEFLGEELKWTTAPKGVWMEGRPGAAGRSLLRLKKEFRLNPIVSGIRITTGTNQHRCAGTQDVPSTVLVPLGIEKNIWVANLSFAGLAVRKFSSPTPESCGRSVPVDGRAGFLWLSARSMGQIALPAPAHSLHRLINTAPPQVLVRQIRADCKPPQGTPARPFAQGRMRCDRDHCR